MEENEVKEEKDMSKWRPCIDKSNLYYIADLNGNVDLLKKCCERIMPLRHSDGVQDILVQGGDIIDRSVNSHLCIDYLIDLKKKYGSSVVVIAGNHERLLLGTMNKIPDKNLSLQDQVIHYRTWTMNGGNLTLQGYLERAGIDADPFTFPRHRISEIIPREHIEFLQNELVYYYEIDDFQFVHAGIEPGIPLNKQDKEFLTWDRSLYKFVKDCINNNQQDKINWEKTVVVGHSASQFPLVHEKFLMLDISVNKKVILLTEMNTLDCLIFHQDKSRATKYELKETQPQNSKKA